jgi:hypothetical protein
VSGDTPPAYYAARPGGWRDWWTLLHPPYTAWHLSYVVIGAALAPRVQASRLIALMVAGPILVVGYNAELFGGVMHTDFGFAAAWGAFPVLTGYVAQAATLAVAPVLAAAGAFALSAAQRRLSTPARSIRRRALRVEGSITFADGRTTPITADTMIRPLELALRATSWAIILLAAAMAVARLG